MCGPFIHGRTFLARNGVFHHRCEPMRINRHWDFPSAIRIVPDIRSPGTADIIVRDYVDWGIRVSNGELEFKELLADVLTSHPDELFSPSERQRLVRNFLPSGRAGLTAWMRKHWGANNDEYDFAEESANCLNIDGLWPSLPEVAVLKTSGSMVRRSSFSGDEKWRSRFLCAVLSGCDDPVESWVKMFRERPNDFWLARN